MYNRAFCYDKLDRIKDAEKDYSAALSLQPINVNVLHHLATLKEKSGDLEGALSGFSKVLSIDRNYAPSYNGRGLVYERMQMHEEALENFSNSISLDPNNPIYWHNRGCCLRNIERFEEAFQDFNKAISLDPENPVIYSNRGLV